MLKVLLLHSDVCSPPLGGLPLHLFAQTVTLAVPFYSVLVPVPTHEFRKSLNGNAARASVAREENEWQPLTRR
jgi:hypothetical protein